MELSKSQTITVPKADAQPNWAGVGVFVAVVLTIIAAVALWNGVFADAWEHYATADEPVPKTEALRNLTWSMGTVGAVFVGFIGLVMAGFRTVSLHRQAKVAETDSKFSEKKHASEAFATAIEQLGNKNYAVRLGAVYALEALAKSSTTLHGPIFETLCAYVRQEAPAPTDDDLKAEIEAQGDRSIKRIVREHLKTIAKPDVVVQAILTVTGRRDPARDPEGFRLDLQETNLRKADMRKGHFANALFNHANLQRADLTDALLDGADLGAAYLEGADLVTAHLKGANLSRASLEGTYLWAANLEGATLSMAHLKGAILWEACLKGATLTNVTFDRLTQVDRADFTAARHIPASPGADFRATVSSADEATWPDDAAPHAWDRGEVDAAG